MTEKLKIATLLTRYFELTEENKELKAENNKVWDFLDDSNKRYKDLESDCMKLKEEKDKIWWDNFNLSTKYDMLSKKYGKLEKKHRKASNMIAGLKAELINDAKNHNEVHHNWFKALDKGKELEIENAELKKENEELKEALIKGGMILNQVGRCKITPTDELELKSETFSTNMPNDVRLEE